MRHELPPDGYPDSLTERILISLGRMGRNMDNSLRHERQLRERNRLIRLAQPLPEQELKLPRFFHDDDYEAEVLSKAPSLEAAADTVLKDAKRGIVIAGRRAAVIGGIILLFRAIAGGEEDTAPNDPLPAPAEDLNYNYDSSAPFSPEPQENLDPADLQLPAGTRQQQLQF